MEKEKKIEQLEEEINKLQSELTTIKKKETASSKFKLWLTSKTLIIFIGPGLKKSILQLYNELPNKVTKETLADVSAHIIWRITRIGFIAFVCALIPGVVLIIQTSLLSKQNNIGLKQNEIVYRQTKLQEQQVFNQERTERSSEINKMYDRIEYELDIQEKNEQNFLSSSTINRINILSRKLKPYTYSENDTLMKYLSSERGELLLFLLSVNLDNETYNKIYLQSDFSFTDLTQANLRTGKLENIILDNSKLKNVDLTRSSLKGASFKNSDLSRANLISSNLVNANFNGAIFKNASIRQCDLSNANFCGTNLISTQFFECNWQFTCLNGAIVDNESWFDDLIKLKNTGLNDIKKKGKLIPIENGKFRIEVNESNPWHVHVH